MRKKLSARTLMESLHVKESEGLLKSTRQYFALLVSETLRLFFNIMTPDEKYSLSVKVSV